MHGRPADLDRLLITLKNYYSSLVAIANANSSCRFISAVLNWHNINTPWLHYDSASYVRKLLGLRKYKEIDGFCLLHFTWHVLIYAMDLPRIGKLYKCEYSWPWVGCPGFDRRLMVVVTALWPRAWSVQTQ